MDNKLFLYHFIFLPNYGLNTNDQCPQQRLNLNVLLSSDNQSLHKNSERRREGAYREFEKKAPGSFNL